MLGLVLACGVELYVEKEAQHRASSQLSLYLHLIC